MIGHYTSVLSVAGLATRTVSGVATAIAVGTWLEGELFVKVFAIGGSATFRPSWESSPAPGVWSMHTSMATFSATGVQRLTLSTLGKDGRLSWTIAGSTAGVRFRSYFVGKA
jgi:hypothetical protein